MKILNFLNIITIFAGILFLILYFYKIYKIIRCIKQLKKYSQLKIGMSETQMLQIMGGNYDKTSIAGGENRYEWHVNNLYRLETCFNTKKVVVKTQHGFITEIRPYNIQAFSLQGEDKIIKN